MDLKQSGNGAFCLCLACFSVVPFLIMFLPLDQRPVFSISRFPSLYLFLHTVSVCERAIGIEGWKWRDRVWGSAIYFIWTLSALNEKEKSELFVLNTLRMVQLWSITQYALENSLLTNVQNSLYNGLWRERRAISVYILNFVTALHVHIHIDSVKTNIYFTPSHYINVDSCV